MRLEAPLGLRLWAPFPGPQEQAYLSPADELFYGGSAGGGKTDLLLGLAVQEHRRSVLFRRTFPQLRSVVERSREVYNRSDLSHLKDSYNEQLHLWRLADGRLVEFAACQYDKDKTAHQGRPRDFYGFDELPEFPETIYRFVTAWNRTTYPNQRCRVVATGNPPTTAEGRWVISYWGPWLDRKHPRPAAPGELRWFASLNGKDVELDGPGEFNHKGERVKPRSRTFIPARLADNPALRDTKYLSVLQALPEPLRSQLLYGDFDAGIEDDPWQVIPTSWVQAAQARWVPETPTGQPMSALGVDVARGGRCKTVLAARYGHWFAPLQKHPGALTDDGPKVAALVLAAHQGEAVINVDVIGVGASVYDHLKGLSDAVEVGPQPPGAHRKRGLVVTPVNNASASNLFDRSGKLRLINVRAAAYWKLREALDPEHGDDLALPPDPELLSDLCAPRYQVTAAGLKVEPKEDVEERIGRSPDCADAVALAHWVGSKRVLKVWV